MRRAIGITSLTRVDRFLLQMFRILELCWPMNLFMNVRLLRFVRVPSTVGVASLYG